jgi:hypothetical protein
VGMTLPRRQHASCLAIGLSKLAVSGARDQTASLLHPFEQACEGGRGEREMVAQRRQSTGGGRFARYDVHQQASDQRLGLLVPMCLRLLVVALSRCRNGRVLRSFGRGTVNPVRGAS